jgi:class 3 adenylate cyclase/tetratricopeptide (TPR) repeat protein
LAGLAASRGPAARRLPAATPPEYSSGVADEIACGACGSANEAGRKFCGECGSVLALTCSSCGTPNRPTVKFCGECGAPLTASPPPPAPVPARAPAAPAPAAERRLVSVLFADLVGFTTASESRDAEETRELLSRYFESARTIVEQYGGLVEKFIGDAVMAVWGTPVAQEDDAERAVRAALDLVAAIPQLDPALRARGGVLTGEAAVTLGAEGEGMVAGDLVNTASRIQSAAEPGTVLVGDATKRASEAAVAYADAGERELKGKAERIQLWRALRVVANRGGERRVSTLEAPFVGRDRELRLAKDLFHATAEDRRATLLTVVGVAGIGKSRLAWELEKHLDGLTEPVWWHRGRCLAYGEGVAFWALAEMVRMRARIADDDPEPSADAKLAAAVEQHITDPGEREWVGPLLRHLLGLGERPQVERADLFSAWRLFFERMSDTAPVALVFEDLHWADTALLDFVEHLLEWSRSRPIFVLALTRPDLLERRPRFGTHGRSSTTLTLEPLDAGAMDALLDGLVPGLPDEIRAQIRDRADGIPLYAVETVRMLLDRGALAREGDVLRVVAPLDRLDVPETLHALIAARLDGLEPEERQVVQHAAVLGKTFGASGVAALGGVDADALVPVLERLVRKELLTVDLDPRSPERGQYGFLQALVQRVAYETLARRERGRLHRAAAAYLEHGAGTDPDEIAEVIAAHHRDAYEADPGAAEAAESRRSACAWLERAGARAGLLGAPDDGLRAYDAAAGLAEESLERGRLLEEAGKLAFQANRMDDAASRSRAAVETYTSAGETHAAARAASGLGLALWQLDRSDEALAILGPAFEALQGDEPDVDVGRLAAEIARIEYFSGNLERARDRIELAIDVGEAHADLVLVSQALNTKSLLVKATRPHERHALLRESLRIAEEHDLAEPMLRAINNLVVLAEELDRPEEADALQTRGLELAVARGHRHYVTWFGSGTISQHFETGAWDEAFAVAREVLPEGAPYNVNAGAAILFLAKASFDRGDDAGVRAWLDRLPPDLGSSGDVGNAMTAGAARSLVALVEGRLAEAIAELASNWDECVAAARWGIAPYNLAWAADGAHQLGHAAAVAPLADRYAAMPPIAQTRFLRIQGGRVRALQAADAGAEDVAADAFAGALAAARSLGRPAYLAPVLADYGAWLVDCGRTEEAEPLLDEARALFEVMGAHRWLEALDRVRPKEGAAA